MDLSKGEGVIIVTKWLEQPVVLGIKNNRLMDYYEGANSSLICEGDIFLGIVQRVLPAMNAAFVQISKENTVMLPFSKEDTLIRVGVCIPVQIVRLPSSSSIQDKRPIATADIALQGRYCVVHKGDGHISYSKKLSKETKESLYNNLVEYEQTLSDKGLCAIIRTASECCISVDQIRMELLNLIHVIEDIERMKDHRPLYTQLYHAKKGIVDKVLLCLQGDYSSIVTDCEDYYQQLLADVTLREYPIMHYQDTSVTLAVMYGLRQKLEERAARKVWLPSGAYIIVQNTEAFHVIDINAGKCEALTKQKSKEDVTRAVNQEALLEISIQMRTRDLRGVILIDLITQEDVKHNEELLVLMREYTKADYVKCRIIDITKLGIMEIIRQ